MWCSSYDALASAGAQPIVENEDRVVKSLVEVLPEACRIANFSGHIWIICVPVSGPNFRCQTIIPSSARSPRITMSLLYNCNFRNQKGPMLLVVLIHHIVHSCLCKDSVANTQNLQLHSVLCVSRPAHHKTASEILQTSLACSGLSKFFDGL